jgi:DNA-damage-inducible protein D
MEQERSIILFKEQHIRRLWHDDQWFFSVVDVVQALTDSVDGRKYWNKLKQRLAEEESEVVTFCHQLKMEAADGKKYKTDCANTEALFRIIQTQVSH